VSTSSRNLLHPRTLAPFVLVLLASILCADPAPLVITITPDHPDALYHCNDPATFTITVTDADKPLLEGEIVVALTFDQGRPLDRQTLKLADQPLKVTSTLAEPGFLHCQTLLTRDGKTVKADSGVGFAPTLIKPICKLPTAFDAFWNAGKAELEKIPLDLKLTPKPEFSDDKQDTFHISFANVDGTRMYGFLSVPKGKGPFPAVFFPPSAGLVKPTKPTDLRWPQQGVLYLDMCIHDFDPTDPPADIEKRTAYTLIGAPDRDKYYFRRAILGLNRGIDYLVSRPDFDKKHLVIPSGSQGGGLALILASLNKNVTAISITKPAMCDWQAPLAGRKAPWPQFLQPAAHRTDEWVKMSEYFDAVNFARSVNVPVLANVGFIDDTCPPSTCYAAFNVIPSKEKTMINLLTQAHFWTVNDEANAWWDLSGRWVRGQLGLGPLVDPKEKDKK